MHGSLRRISRVILVTAALVALAGMAPAHAQQMADTLFVPKVGKPLHASGNGPIVLIDEAHHNFHTADGRYLPFARTLRADGYVVRPSRERFTRDALQQGRVLVIANALAAQNTDEWTLPTPSAFDSSEIAAVESWVRDGGALFLIADHMPFPGAAEDLARAFGIYMVNGFATIDGGDEGRLTFTREGGTLADHPITRGRQASEHVEHVVSFMGQAFRITGAAQPLMTLEDNMVLLLPMVAWQFSSLTPAMWAGGMQQGAVVQHGKGRVAVFGEAAMFSAQVSGQSRMGMNDPTASENAQFLLNVVHWLEGAL